MTIEALNAKLQGEASKDSFTFILEWISDNLESAQTTETWNHIQDALDSWPDTERELASLMDMPCPEALALVKSIHFDADEDSPFLYRFLTNPEFSTITHLTLQMGGMASEDLAELCRASFPTLKHLSLANNRLSSENIELLCRTNWPQTLQSLDLSENDLGDEAVCQLSKQHFPYLRFLKLDGNELTAKSAIHLAKTNNFKSLESLHMQENNIANEGAAALLSSKLLSHLHTLNLTDNDITSGLIELCSPNNNSMLTHLLIAWNRLFEEDVSSLQALPQLAKTQMIHEINQ